MRPTLSTTLSCRWSLLTLFPLFPFFFLFFFFFSAHAFHGDKVFATKGWVSKLFVHHSATGFNSSTAYMPGFIAEKVPLFRDVCSFRSVQLRLRRESSVWVLPAFLNAKAILIVSFGAHYETTPCFVSVANAGGSCVVLWRAVIPCDSRFFLVSRIVFSVIAATASNDFGRPERTE